MAWGPLSDIKKAVDDYSKKHKEHMALQWEKQAQKAKAAEPLPLTETQRVWQALAQERAAAEQQEQHQQQQAPAAYQQQQQAAAPTRAAVAQQQAPAVSTTTPRYTITWQVRLSSLGHIPMPWETATQ